jgi:glycosyltransferase involved in cell wall biosynthesis
MQRAIDRPGRPHLGLPNVRLICQDNGGKPSALNTGIAHARHDVPRKTPVIPSLRDLC